MSGQQPTAPGTLSAEIRAGVFVVIAAYNEGSAIGSVVAELAPNYHVVVVDDGSGDDTADAAAGAGAHVLRHVINRGQGAALQTGIDYALLRGARQVVTFDADGQHQASDIPALVGPVAAGEVDICLGSRFLEHADAVPFARRVLLAGAVLFTLVSSRLRLTDAHNGLRAFSRRAAGAFDIRLDRMAHASELIDQIRESGLSFREVPVHIRYTAYSMAKGQRGSAALRVLFDYLVGRVLR